uniref:Mini-chromosome maintenance complex-binding protein n=1 Tax=Rhodnius prolixus TaxID=13249 RepID=A0A4P6D665_RHOPR
MPNLYKANWDKIPLLNCVPDYKLSEGQLVRFCGMIQDMPNPVYYYSSYEVLNIKTGLKEIRSGKYRDSLQCDENESLILDSGNCQNQERQLYFCVSVPALNEWAEPKYVYETSQESAAISYSSKRNAEDMEVDGPGPVEIKKRLCSSVPSSEKNGSQNLTQYYPVPSPNNYSCVVHTYDDTADSQLKVNDVIEICGFINFSPLSQDNELPNINIPRLHAVTLKTIKSLNPYCSSDPKHNQILSEAKKLRSELHLVLTQLLLGDSLAADYLICHLIAHVYARLDSTVLGKFTVNLSNIPRTNDYITNLYKLISQLLPKTHYLPMSLETMNSTEMIPKKNYETDRLQTGLLQLSEHTHLVIDETKLEVGKLEEKGVKNIQALKCLIENQKLDYDFKFFTVEFLTDVPVLILSEGKSLLPSDCHIVLTPLPEYTSSLEECYLAIGKYLRQPLLDQLRQYLALVTTVTNFNLPEHLLQTIENDLVQQRHGADLSSEKSSADDFHARLVLARLMSLSYGEKELTKNIWDQTGVLEKNRKLRLNVHLVNP